MVAAGATNCSSRWVSSYDGIEFLRLPNCWESKSNLGGGWFVVEKLLYELCNYFCLFVVLFNSYAFMNEKSFLFRLISHCEIWNSNDGFLSFNLYFLLLFIWY